MCLSDCLKAGAQKLESIVEPWLPLVSHVAAILAEEPVHQDEVHQVLGRVPHGGQEVLAHGAAYGPMVQSSLANQLSHGVAHNCFHSIRLWLGVQRHSERRRDSMSVGGQPPPRSFQILSELMTAS